MDCRNPVDSRRARHPQRHRDVFLAVGVGLVAAALNPRRNAIAVVVAAIAGVMHAILHLYSHAAGLLSTEHLTTEALAIYIPAILLIAIGAILYRDRGDDAVTQARAA
jgi:predicted anti-sigma-YlaC factor YlaD